jgi:hypothetical protein
MLEEARQSGKKKVKDKRGIRSARFASLAMKCDCNLEKGGITQAVLSDRETPGTHRTSTQREELYNA